MCKGKIRIAVWFAALWMGILAAALPLQAGQDLLYFVQITDTHLGIRENNERTRKIVAAVNALPMKIHCVVHTGDIYDRSVRDDPGAVARAAGIFKNLHVPVYFLPGNNEIDLFGAAGGTRDAYTRQFSPLTYSKEIAGVLFVFAYTDPLREGIDMPGFDPFDALQKELASAGSRPVLLFHHGPSVRDFYLNRFHPGWDAGTGEKWLALINSCNVAAVIAGHYHRDEFHWLDQVPLYVSGPVAGKFSRQAGFRIYEYEGGKLSYTAQYLE